MLSDIYTKDTENLFRTPIIQQTGFWSVVKQKMGTNSIALDYKISPEEIGEATISGSKVESDVLIVLHQLGRNHTIGYVPYGPEIEPLQENQGTFLEELSESIRPFLPKHCIMIRYDLLWESHWAHDENCFDERGWWLGPPASSLQELRFNFNTSHWNIRKTSSNILPSNTLFLNLRDSYNELLSSMKPKTRYNIKLSQRRGVTVRKAGLNEIDIWSKLYSETAARNGIYLHDVEYFKSIMLAKKSSTLSPADVVLLIAEADGEPLAAMFLVISYNRASYLYGASSDTGRNRMATYALQWEAIKLAKERGCKDYDMFGVSPNPDPSHPMYGLYRFKAGFGGSMYHSMGCWDYPLCNEQYNYYTGTELKGQGYHLS